MLRCRKNSPRVPFDQLSNTLYICCVKDYVDQNLLLQLIKENCEKISKDNKNYRNELFSALGQIVALERQHQMNPSRIQVQVSDQVEALGQVIPDEGDE